MNRRRALTVLAAALPAQAPSARGREPAWQRYEFVSPHMGTLWRLVVHSRSREDARQARLAAWETVAAVDEALSDYREESELSRLNRSGRLEEPGPLLRAALSASLGVAELTGGAFDPTVGPLVALWRESRRSGRLPEASAVEEARGAVGWRRVRVDGGRVELPPGGRLDFGGIAKGQAQDLVLEKLRAMGVTRALIDAGGGVAVGDSPPEDPHWVAAVGSLSGDEVVEQVGLRSAALATSGDLHQFVEIGGRRYSHIVDSRTGLGLTRRVQASVVAPEAITADALATAFTVMEEGAVRDFVENRPPLAARLAVLEEGGRVRVWRSSLWKRLRVD